MIEVFSVRGECAGRAGLAGREVRGVRSAGGEEAWEVWRRTDACRYVEACRGEVECGELMLCE